MFYALGYFIQFASQTKALVTNDSELSDKVDEHIRRMNENKLLDDIENQRIQQSLSNSSYFGEIFTLRITSLRKNENISGKIFLPIDVIAKTVDFIFPIDDNELHITYNQEGFLSKRNLK